MFQGEDLEHSQQESLRALNDMRSDGSVALSEHSDTLCDAGIGREENHSESHSKSGNPYAGLYSDDLPGAPRPEQSPPPSTTTAVELDHPTRVAHTEAIVEKERRSEPSRGSDVESGSQSVADEVESNGDCENFVEEEF